jgi:hypothetical protein
MKTITVRGDYQGLGKTTIARKLQDDFPDIEVYDYSQGTDEEIFSKCPPMASVVICVREKERFPVVIRNDDAFFVVYRKLPEDGMKLSSHELYVPYVDSDMGINLDTLGKLISPFLIEEEDD